ncbi:MAG: dihydrofolate reductase [Bacteroidetes bacterium]|nr:dihydrofolate reductase [Bacteroidota bacterium]HET6243501.1 dihydrofolate reductase [Bacteroidia bacterium]
MIKSFLVAVAKNNVIGKDNKLPWYLPADLRFFKNLTTGHHIIMGRKTFESFGKPLPNRTSVVITRKKDYNSQGCIVVHSIEEAIKTAAVEKEIFIIGGEEIFSQSMSIADRIYLTRINEEFEGDAFFPELNSQEWKLKEKQDFEADEKNKYGYSFCIYERK